MKMKEEIVANWLPRHTKRPLEAFGQYILLTNFNIPTGALLPDEKKTVKHLKFDW